jgi:transposase InsO family protein
MDLARYAVDAVLIEGASCRAVAARLGRSKSWVNKQVLSYRTGGYEALVPKRRGAHSFPNQTSGDLEDEILWWRKSLEEEGFDAGARTIRYYLAKSHTSVPAVSTIHAVLVRRGFVTPQPQKRPRSSWIRFEASLPNETWQSDMTHWSLADGTGVEIVNFIDDYSRAVMACVVVDVATSADVVRIFHKAAETYGFPESLLTDNGAIFTASYRNGTAAMETEMYSLGIVVKHGKPYHPQTQGKVERFHDTLKRYLRKQPKAGSLIELQSQLDRFVLRYNEDRPQSARGNVPPLVAWRTLDKAGPKLDDIKLDPHTRVRHDTVDKTGSFTIRHNGRLHHIGMGRKLKGQRIIVLVNDLDIRVLTPQRVLLRHLILDPSKDYQPL